MENDVFNQISRVQCTEFLCDSEKPKQKEKSHVRQVEKRVTRNRYGIIIGWNIGPKRVTDKCTRVRVRVVRVPDWRKSKFMSTSGKPFGSTEQYHISIDLSPQKSLPRPPEYKPLESNKSPIRLFGCVRFAADRESKGFFDRKITVGWRGA